MFSNKRDRHAADREEPPRNHPGNVTGALDGACGTEKRQSGEMRVFFADRPRRKRIVVPSVPRPCEPQGTGWPATFPRRRSTGAGEPLSAEGMRSRHLSETSRATGNGDIGGWSSRRRAVSSTFYVLLFLCPQAAASRRALVECTGLRAPSRDPVVQLIGYWQSLRCQHGRRQCPHRRGASSAFFLLIGSLLR